MIDEKIIKNIIKDHNELLFKNIMLYINNCKHNMSTISKFENVQKEKNNYTSNKSETKVDELVTHKNKKEIECFDRHDVQNEIERETIQLKKCTIKKNIVKCCESLRYCLRRLSIVIPLHCYIVYLKKIIEEIEKIFLPLYTKSKKNQLVLKIFSTVDIRLIQHPLFIYTNVKKIDIEYLKNIIISNMMKQKKLKDILENIEYILQTYSIALLDVYDLIKIIFNKCNHIVYKNETFYVLTKIEDNNYFFSEDYKLITTTHTILNKLLPYSIKLFRNIYFQVFNDNIHRAGYKKQTIVTEYDCDQLLQNIKKMCKSNQIQSFLNNIVKSHCIFEPTKNIKYYFENQINSVKVRDSKEPIIDISYDNCINELFDNNSIENN